jgi:hypothetical protein
VWRMKRTIKATHLTRQPCREPVLSPASAPTSLNVGEICRNYSGLVNDQSRRPMFHAGITDSRMQTLSGTETAVPHPF